MTPPHHRLRVLMISKACIVGIYQRKLEAMAALGIDLLTLVPPAWTDERGRQPLERVHTTGYRLEVIPIVRDGDFHTHFYRGVSGWMQRFRPHIVHIDEEPYNLAAWQAFYHARRAGAKTVAFSWQNIDRRYPPPFAWGERWLLRGLNALIAGTDDAAAVWRAKGYTGRLAVIPQFGTDAAVFRPPATPRPDRPFTVGYVGRLVEEKGIGVLIEAVARLGGDARLIVLGGGPLRAALIMQATGLGLADRVQFDPQVASTQMAAQYSRFDVLVLPSLTRAHWKEQFGRVLVEAMASGVPVVGSNSGAIPGVIGKAGLIVPEGDAAGLAAALGRLHEDADLRRRLVMAGRQRAMALFSHDGVAAATVALYHTMIES